MKSHYSIIASIILGVSFSITAQTVNIPDPVFKAYLLGEPAINTNMDGEIQVTEAATYTGDIDITNAGISDFTGLQSFIAVEDVYINGNNHTTLDLTGMTSLWKIVTDDSDSLQTIIFSGNPNLAWVDVKNCNLSSINTSNLPALNFLHISGNPITSVNLTYNPWLQVLSATACNLTSLDVSNNPALVELYTVWNGITSLDLSGNPNLGFVNVSSCNLTYLNIANGNNTNLSNSEFRCNNNFFLQSVCVDDTAYSNNNWYTYVDSFVEFTDTCASSPGVGIWEMNDNSIQVMNNPTHDFIYLKEPISYQVINSSGQVVIPATLSNRVDMRELTSGIYFMLASPEGSNGTFKSVKLLKQ